MKTVIPFRIMLALILFTLLLVPLPAIGGPLHDSAHSGNLEKVKRLIEVEKIPVNQKGYLKETALHWAARGGHLDVVTYLVSKGAAVDARDGSETPPSSGRH